MGHRWCRIRCFKVREQSCRAHPIKRVPGPVLPHTPKVKGGLFLPLHPSLRHSYLWVLVSPPVFLGVDKRHLWCISPPRFPPSRSPALSLSRSLFGCGLWLLSCFLSFLLRLQRLIHLRYACLVCVCVCACMCVHGECHSHLMVLESVSNVHIPALQSVRRYQQRRAPPTVLFLRRQIAVFPSSQVRCLHLRSCVCVCCCVCISAHLCVCVWKCIDLPC